MFSKRIISSARFLKMPISSQALYFHLGLHADDDGVVEAYTVMQSVGVGEDDLRVLCSKGFVKVLNEDLVSYITDWRENNKLRADRKIDSIYKNLLLEMLPEIELLKATNRVDRPPRFQNECMGRPAIEDGTAQDRLGKDSIVQDSIDSTKKRKRFEPPTLDEVKAYCLERKNNVDAERFFDYYSANGWVQGKGKPIKDWKACVRTWERGNGFATSVKKPKESISEHWNNVENRAMPTAEEIEFFKRQAENKK